MPDTPQTRPAAAPDAAAPVEGVLTTHAPRLIFVDLARAIGVIFMLQGHTLEALLDPAYRAGPIFGIWVFQRGLTSCLFLLLSGFAFSVATTRKWDRHVRLSRVSLSRLRRFGFFVLLGYGLHFPAARFADLSTLSDERWRTFLAVDILQLSGVSLIVLQLLVLVLRTPRVFMAAAFAGCALVVAVTPAAWAVDWSARLPLWLAAYLSSATGSQFPLIPWSAYVMLGAGLGQIYEEWGSAHLTAFANRVLLRGGALMIVASVVLSRLPFEPFGPSDFWSTSPNQFLLRAGSVLLILAGIAYVSRRLTSLPPALSALAHKSLLVYFTHLCVVYGSVWNTGLQSYLGAKLSLGAASLVVVAVIASMALLAWAWNWCKRAHPRVARVVKVATLGYLVWALV